MTFFDKKSEVIKIELTSYGKYLLSRGKFKPVYYEFLDNNILYDSSYVGITENRNNISERIKNETPSLKPQYVFSGIETKLKELTKIKIQLQNQRKTAVKDEELIENAQTFEKLYYNFAPLGNSNLDNTYPALNLKTYNIEISSSQTYKLTNSHPMHVPQIILKDINYSSSILVADEDFLRLNGIEENQPPVDINLLSPQQLQETTELLEQRVFPDNTYISIEDKSNLLHFFEENVKNIGDNFEVEIYTYETGSSNQEIIKQLYFNNSEEPTDDSSKVEYYFEIIKDSNIEKKDLKSIKQIKEPQVFKINK